MKLVYDIASMPKGLDPSNLTKMYEQHHIIFWDSNKEGTKPRLFSDDGAAAELTIVDMAGKEFDITRYSEEFADKEHWDKELHKCKQSAIYYFTHYKTTEWPATNENIRVYLESVGMKDIAANDSANAAEAWEAAKVQNKAATEHLTIDILKEEFERTEVIKNEYFARVEKLEVKLRDSVKLFTPENERLSDKKLKSNLVAKIRLHPIPSSLKEYRTKKNKWDSPMLFVTNYDVLLHILDEVLTYSAKFDTDKV